MKQLLTFILFAFIAQVYSMAQSIEKNDFNRIITFVTGDLNKDGLLDSVIVTQDTLTETRPYQLEIWFIDVEGNAILAERSDSAIEPQFPNGPNGYITGNGFDILKIVNGVLWIENQLLRGYYNHKFRYQNEHFELIGFTYVSSDGLGKIYNIDYNLSTGKLIELTESYQDNEVFKDTTSVVKLSVLPTLSEFEPFSGDHY